MFHTSPNLITTGTINKYGIAGDCLFFSDDVYSMSSASVYTYKADFNCVSTSELYNDDIIADIANYFDVDLEIAESLLDASENEYDHGADADGSWYLQGKRGECAVSMGYDGCRDEDEQGTVYIVPMLNRESELVQVQ